MRWTVQSGTLPSGRRGTLRTLQAMRRLALQGQSRPEVIQFAHDAIRGSPERNDPMTMRVLLAVVRQWMRYTPDPLGAEVVKAPWVVVEHIRRTGLPEPMDCDDASTLLASLLGALGIVWDFVAVRADGGRPQEFSHVYVRARNTQTGQWTPLDPIVRGWGAGREVPDSALQGPRLALSGYRQEEHGPMSKFYLVSPSGQRRFLSGTTGMGAGFDFGPLLNQGIEILKNKYGGGSDDSKKLKDELAKAQRRAKNQKAKADAATAAAMARPVLTPTVGLFQKIDSVTGQAVADPLKIGLAVVGVGLAGYLALRISKRRGGR